MLEVLTAEEMKKADLAAIAQGLPTMQLVESAGAGLAAVIEKNIAPCPVLFLCGAGNNGADGFIAAARLKEKGWPVRVACLSPRKTLKGTVAEAAKKWTGDVEPLNSNLSVHQTALAVDAVFGTGFRDALPPELVVLFDKIRTRKIPVVAVDVPSGLNATTGKAAAGTLHADITVTFCRKKIAHLLRPGRDLCGRLHKVELPIADDIVSGLNTQVFENNPALWLRDFPLPGADSYKYSRGHAVVYGGSLRTGAARLSAAAAQRVGAGVVSIACAPDAQTIYATAAPASIMVDAWQTAEDFKTLLRDERKTALVLGPGAGSDDRLREAVLSAVGFNKAAVLDADVFTAFKNRPQDLFSKLSPQKHVLTPHEGEFTRLFGDGHAAESKLERARAAARTAQAIVVLKGADTVIAAPDGTAIIHAAAPATLATAGSGDVLAGLIAGLAAQGMPVFMASAAAVWLQSLAARQAGLGLVAEDIISLIPQSLNHLFAISAADA